MHVCAGRTGCNFNRSNGSVGLGAEAPYDTAGSISELALVAAQFCPGVYIRRSKSRSRARLVSLRFGICSERKSGQSVAYGAEPLTSRLHVLSIENIPDVYSNRLLTPTGSSNRVR